MSVTSSKSTALLVGSWANQGNTGLYISSGTLIMKSLYENSQHLLTFTSTVSDVTLVSRATPWAQLIWHLTEGFTSSPSAHVRCIYLSTTSYKTIRAYSAPIMLYCSAVFCVCSIDCVLLQTRSFECLSNAQFQVTLSALFRPYSSMNLHVQTVCQGWGSFGHKNDVVNSSSFSYRWIYFCENDVRLYGAT